MATFTLQQYFLSRVPDIATLLPGYDIATATNAAMALYWDKFFTNGSIPAELDESNLTERQKVLVSLRAVLSLVPVFTKALVKPQVTHAEGGPAVTKFEERSKIYRQLLPLWEAELMQLEQAEGIESSPSAPIPAFLEKIHSHDNNFSTMGYVANRDATFVKGD